MKLTPAVAKQKLGGRKTDSAGESSEPSTDSSTEEESEYEIEEIYQVTIHIYIIFQVDDKRKLFFKAFILKNISHPGTKTFFCEFIISTMNQVIDTTKTRYISEADAPPG